MMIVSSFSFTRDPIGYIQMHDGSKMAYIVSQICDGSKRTYICFQIRDGSKRTYIVFWIRDGSKMAYIVSQIQDGSKTADKIYQIPGFTRNFSFDELFERKVLCLMDICSEDDDDGTPPMKDEVPNNMMDPHGDSSHSGNSSLSAKKSSHFLLILLLILLCMKPVICSSPSKPMFEASKAVINSTAMSFSACVLPLKECPNSGKDKENHIWCIRDFKEKSCPLGYDYMCGKEKSGYLVEGCFERSSCPIGTANEIHFNPETKQASLSCEECPKDLIQPWPHDSSRIFRSGCQQNRVPLSIHTQKDRMKMVYDGHPREEDQYICDTSQGYSDISGNLLCNANTLCTCEKKVVCQNHLELLPNGKCKPICAEERVMPDFSCDKFVSEDSTSIPPSSTGATSSGEDLNGTATDSAQGSADATPVLQSSDGGGFAVGYIILIVVGAIVVVMIVIGAVVYCCKKRTRPRQNQSIEEEQGELLEMLPNSGIRPECNGNRHHEPNHVATVKKRTKKKTIVSGLAIKAKNAKNFTIYYINGTNHKTNEEEDQGRNQERDQEMDQRRDQEMDQRRDQETDLEMDQRRDQEMDQRRNQGRNQRRDQEMDQGRDQEMVIRMEGDGEEQPESSNMDDQTAVKAIYAPEGVAQPEMQYLK